MPLAPGTRLGPYEVVDLLGAGGMGEVYRATDTNLKRQVAVKALPPSMAADPDRLARFQREAEVLAALNHPNIAAIYGLERTESQVALVMELVAGPTLADRVARGAIPIEEALLLAGQIADALAAAHEQGIIHRDLKPANIKVRDDGTVKVLDFGLAKAMDPVVPSTISATMSPTISMHATVAGVILGTAAYMSPEQASGKAVDKRADIWAFGVVLWEMLTGRQMFEGETISHVLAAVLTAEPNLATTPARVRRLLASCLEKDPRKRLRDIGDAMRFVQESAVESRADAAPRRSVAMLGWVAAAVMAFALAFGLWSRPVANTAGDLPVVRFQIERQSVDPYNNATTAFAVSPDGRFLAHYTTASNGQATLSVRTLASGESREVPGSTILSPVAPFWSADSRQVVYGTLLTSEVFDVVTATTRQLCACRFQGGSWNREGVILLGFRGALRGSIRRVSLQDRTPVPVTTVDSAKSEQDAWPVFLPDGRRFLFTRSSSGAAPVTYLASLDGDAPRRITDGARRLFIDLLNGSGPHLLGIDGAGLVAQRLDGATLAPAGEPVIVAAGVAAASVSDNGVLATSVPARPPSMRPTWFARTGAELGGIGPAGPIQGINLSANGGTFAIGEANGSGPDIWLRDAAGTNRRLTFNGGNANAVWSADGTRVIVSTRQNDVTNMYERAADGTGQETRLFPAERNTFANDWSPDGKFVIYTIPKAGGELDLDLWIFPTDGRPDRKPAPYLTSLAREAQAEFSPDGRFVAYTLVDAGTPEVYVQPFPDASQGKWLVSNGGGAEPHWSRDGKELFYVAGQTMMAVPVTLQPTFSSGSPVRLFDAPVQPWYVNDSDRSQVAPDGKRFVLLVPSGENSAPPIDVIVNWPALLGNK